MRVLSIDFDIIMEPCVNLYNSIAGEDNTGIREIEQEFPFIRPVLLPNFITYEKVTAFLINIFKSFPKENITFINDHNQIAHLLKDATDVDLCNIDHHHDICYDDLTVSSRIILPDVGNWVKYLYDRNIITHYTWINNPNSIFPDDDIEDYYLDENYEFQQINLLQIIGKFDKLIICHSPQWVPTNYDALWNIWLTIANEMYDTTFEVI